MGARAKAVVVPPYQNGTRNKQEQISGGFPTHNGRSN
jgi:hypothetical protein